MVKVGDLDGWGQNAAHLSEITGLSISVQQARRYAARTNDPLPVRRVGRRARPHVVAFKAQLEAWVLAEFHSTQSA